MNQSDVELTNIENDITNYNGDGSLRERYSGLCEH